MKVGYARVSTREQSLQLQILALEKAGAKKIYQEKVSSIKEEREKLKELINYVREGDTVIVYKLDRIARSLKHMIEIAEILKQKKVNLISLTENIDTTTAIGNFFFQLIGAFAEMERNIIVERTRAGLSAAREQGRIGGRKKGLSKKAKNKAKAAANLYHSKFGEMTIDEMLEVLEMSSRATFYRYLKYERVELLKLKKLNKVK